MIGCEEGWTYIAEWKGVPLSYILDRVGALPQVRYVVYRSIQTDWWESIDMADALHPQTLVATGMNGENCRYPSEGRCACVCPGNSVTRASNTSIA